MNLIKVMSNDQPEPEPGLDPQGSEAARRIWQTTMDTPCSFTIEMQNIVPFVECKARFSTETVSADKEIEMDIFLRANCPFPVRFSKLSVFFNNQVYNQYCCVVDGHGVSAASESEGTGADLYLVPGKTKNYKFSFLPIKDDVDTQIEINAVVLEFGLETGCLGKLKWIGGGGDAVTPLQTALSILPKEINRQDPLEWDNIDVKSVIKVTHRPANVTFTLHHEPPCLLNEFYQIVIDVENKETLDIMDVRLTFGLKDQSPSPATEETAHISMDKAEYDGNVECQRMEANIGVIHAGKKSSRHMFIKNMQTGSKTVFVKVEYSITVPAKNTHITCSCQKEEFITMTTVSPFDVAVKLQSMKFEEIENIQAEEPFILLPELTCTSPWPVEFKSSQLQMPENIQSTDEETVSQIQGVCLKKTECATECFCLVTSTTTQTSTSLGTYTVYWRRKTSEEIDLPFVTTSFPLPGVNIEHIPISMDLRLPAYGSVKQLLPLCYVIHNRTSYPQEIEVSMEPNDNFMFSGNKQIHFRVLPGKPYNLMYNLFPLMAGHLLLPKISINMTRYPGMIDPIVQKMLPSHIFIKPTGKTLSAGM